MNTIVTILNSLKIDSTVVIQFVLFVVCFNVIAPLLFKKLQQVLENREEKTTRLESHAHYTYKQVEDLEKQYLSKINKTHEESQMNTSKIKQKVLEEERNAVKTAEDKIVTTFESKKSEMLKELAAKKNEALKSAQDLSKNLVDKFIN